MTTPPIQMYGRCDHAMEMSFKVNWNLQYIHKVVWSGGVVLLGY